MNKNLIITTVATIGALAGTTAALAMSQPDQNQASTVEQETPTTAEQITLTNPETPVTEQQTPGSSQQAATTGDEPAPENDPEPTPEPSPTPPPPVTVVSETLQYRINLERNREDAWCIYGFSDNTSQERFMGARPIGEKHGELECSVWKG